jgi:hypothetical protein
MYSMGIFDARDGSLIVSDASTTSWEALMGH